MNSSIVSIDIGCSKIACLVTARGENGSMAIVAAGSVPCRGLRKGVIVDHDEVVTSLQELVRELDADLDDISQPVVVSIGGSHVHVDHVKGLQPIYPKTRPITRQDVLSVINHSRKQVIAPDMEEVQAIPQEFSIDGLPGIRKPIGMSGGRLEVSTLLVMAESGPLRNIERALESTRFVVDPYVLKPLASGLGVLNASQLESGAVVVDLGAGTTEIGVFVNGSIAYSASIPIGASAITSDLSKLLKTSPEEAERLKLRYGVALANQVMSDETVGVMQLGQIQERPLQRRVLAEIIESRLREIATFVRQHLERSGLDAHLAAGIVLTGGGALLPGTADLFADVLPGQPISLGTPGFKGKSVEWLDGPQWATVVGLSRFALNSNDDVLATVENSSGIGGRIKTIWSLLGGKR